MLHNGNIQPSNKFIHITLLLGLAIVITITLISNKIYFAPVNGFGPRELSHFIGFTGMCFVMFYYISFFQKGRDIKYNLYLHIPLITLYILSFIFSSIKNIFISNEFIEIFGVLLILYFPYLWFASIKFSFLKRPRDLILLSGFILIMMTILWEVITQPYLGSYGKGPNGYIQWNQVLADTIGVIVGSMVLFYLTKQPKQKVI